LLALPAWQLLSFFFAIIRGGVVAFNSRTTGCSLVQAQATSTYVDLFANLALAAFVMLTFLMYTRKEIINGKYLALLP